MAILVKSSILLVKIVDARHLGMYLLDLKNVECIGWLEEKILM